MSEFAKYYHAVEDATWRLYQRGYETENMIVYAHPETKHNMYDAAREENQMLDLESDSIAGFSILESQSLPKDIVMTVVIEHLQRGRGDAIEFAEIEEPD